MLNPLYNTWLHDKASYEHHVDDVLNYLKAEVHAKFSNRYKAESESFFTSRHVSVQVRVNLYKLAKATYETLKGLFE